MHASQHDLSFGLSCSGIEVGISLLGLGGNRVQLFSGSKVSLIPQSRLSDASLLVPGIYEHHREQLDSLITPTHLESTHYSSPPPSPPSWPLAVASSHHLNVPLPHLDAGWRALPLCRASNKLSNTPTPSSSPWFRSMTFVLDLVAVLVLFLACLALSCEHTNHLCSHMITHDNDSCSHGNSHITWQ